jgi:hypothetical protein
VKSRIVSGYKLFIPTLIVSCHSKPSLLNGKTQQSSDSPGIRGSLLCVFITIVHFPFKQRLEQRSVRAVLKKDKGLPLFVDIALPLIICHPVVSGIIAFDRNTEHFESLVQRIMNFIIGHV